MYAPIEKNALIREIVEAIEMNIASDCWSDGDLQKAMFALYPGRFAEDRNFRNQLQRFCADSKRYRKEYPGGLLRAPLFEQVGKNLFKFASGYQQHLGLDDFVLENEDERYNEERYAEIINDPSLSETERDVLCKSRRGQGKFKTNVISIEKKCRITGIIEPSFLIASHIKPWSHCETNKERLDGHNGFLFTPNIDKMFDKGYITFEDDGTMLMSSELDKSIYEKYGVTPTNIGFFSEQQKYYLKYHRENRFNRLMRKGEP